MLKYTVFPIFVDESILYDICHRKEQFYMSHTFEMEDDFIFFTQL